MATDTGTGCLTVDKHLGTAETGVVISCRRSWLLGGGLEKIVVAMAALEAEALAAAALSEEEGKRTSSGSRRQDPAQLHLRQLSHHAWAWWSGLPPGL